MYVTKFLNIQNRFEVIDKYSDNKYTRVTTYMLRHGIVNTYVNSYITIVKCLFLMVELLQIS